MDPPFNSKRDYNIPLGGKAQARVFQDTWVWSKTQDESMDYLAREPELHRQVQLLLQFAGGGQVAGGGGLVAYLAYMAARLYACRRALKETGSIYLHCDPTAGHYLKLLLDAVFGSKNFRNEVVWAYKGAALTASVKVFPRKHDNLFFYTKGSKYKFENPREDILSESMVRRWGKYLESDGKTILYKSIMHEPAEELRSRTRIQKRCGRDPEENDIAFIAKPSLLRSVWEIPEVRNNPKYKETTGYPTQKPLKLLERIIRASSNEGDLVLDPFCGCGTAVEAAQNLGRRWIGIDVEPLAVDLMARRLRDRCGVDPQIRGIPYDFAQARRLAEDAPYEFERWALRLVPGAQPNFKQSGDGGVDGRAVVNAETRPQPLFGFQVKGGQHVGRPAADAFRGALTQNGCTAGLLIVLSERNAQHLRHAMGAQERVQLNGWAGPRISVWSVEDWFASGLQCTVSRPALVGAEETLDLLRPGAWQRRLDG